MTVSEAALPEQQTGGTDRPTVSTGFEGTLAAVIAGFVLLFVLGASVVLLYERNRANNEQVTATLAAQLQISHVLSLVEQAETGQRGYLLAQDLSYLRPYTAALAALPPEVASLQAALASGGGLSGPVADLPRLVQQKTAEMQRIIELDQHGDRAGALTALRSNLGRDLMTAIRDALAAATVQQKIVLATRFEAVKRDSRISLTVDTLAIIVILTLAAATITRLRRATADLARSRGELAAANENLEETVEKRTADLREANEEIQRFAYIVSHDLRAPLVNIMGFTSELETAVATVEPYVDQQAAEGTLPEAVRYAIKEDFPEALRFIKTSTGRMDGLIGAILKLSREGRRTLTAEQIDMRALVEEAVANIQHQSASAGARIAAKTLPPLVSDRMALEQVFANLLENAVKYLKPGRAGEIEVRGQVLGSRVVYEVADNGRGIAAHDHQRIFELFRRSGVQDRPGEGIGLAHVRTLVRSLGGTIDCVSSLDEGTTFRLSFPRRRVPEGSTIA